MSATRIQPADCLYEAFLDLCDRASTLRPWEGEARQDWTDASRDLLRAVPDASPRAAWAILLAEAFAGTMPGVPLALIARMLLEGEQ